MRDDISDPTANEPDPWDQHWRDRDIYDEQTADPRPPVGDGRSPAVAHALMTGQARTAAAIHVLDGIDSAIWSRTAVTMDGIDWTALRADRGLLSGGEQLLLDAAEQICLHGTLPADLSRHLAAGVDRDCRVRVADALLIVRTGR